MEKINQLQYEKNLYCTNNGILIGIDKKNNSLIKRYLTCNLGLSA
jgi:hypothetical protein